MWCLGSSVLMVVVFVWSGIEDLLYCVIGVVLFWLLLCTESYFNFRFYISTICISIHLSASRLHCAILVCGFPRSFCLEYIYIYSFCLALIYAG